MPPLALTPQSNLRALIQIITDKSDLTGTSAIARGLAEHYGRDDNASGSPDPLGDVALNRVHERTVDAFFATHSRGLAALGLEVSYNPAPTLAAEAGLKQSRQGSLLLLDESRLVGFLRQLTPDMVDDAGRNALSALATDLHLQCGEQLSLAVTNESEPPALSPFEAAGAQLARLGVHEGQQIIDSIAAFQAGIYVEHVQARSILDNRGWGPATWHRDSQPDSYQQRWERMLESFDRVRQNPDARTLAIEVYHFLRESAGTARGELEGFLNPGPQTGSDPQPSGDPWMQSVAPQMLDTLTVVDTELAVRREALDIPPEE